ncbi:MAG TPA: UDP-N-acetylmuramoyl-tripeptide--D-alanyl-D-alanine ligase [Acidisarcina sp.]
MKLDLEQIARWMGAGVWFAPDETGEAPATGYSIDSRTLNPGDLFFAVQGAHFDGHDFLTSAMERGARAAVVSRAKAAYLPEAVKLKTLLMVDNDPLLALQRLAAAVRHHWGRRVVAITGSAGKTTTKDTVAAVLATKFNVLKSQGNLNNHFGLPLQLLRIEPDHDVAVIEMGMSAAGEIAALAKIATPNWGVVTNVGNAHAENFSSGIGGVARAKYELVEALPHDGVAFLNCDDTYVSQFGRGFNGKVIYFGAGPCSEPRAENIEELGSEGVRFSVLAREQRVAVTLSVLGRHNVTNAIAAIAVGLEAGVPLADCARALAGLQAADKRGVVLRLRGATLINDSYNSNPEALQSMIGTLASLPAKRRILIAGEMLELGSEAPELHRTCGRLAAKRGIDIVVGVRGNAKFIVEGAAEAGAESIFLETPEESGQWLRIELQSGDAVLLKASRGVRLEKALEALDEVAPETAG